MKTQMCRCESVRNRFQGLRVGTMSGCVRGCLVITMLWVTSSIAWAANMALSSGDWHSAIWSEGIPVAGQDVVIPNGISVTLSNATPALNSFTGGGTLVFNNWTTKLTATTVTVSNGGTITHGVNTDQSAPWVPDARVWIESVNFTVALGGTVNVNAKGYQAIGSQGGEANPGKGPGGGKWGAGAGWGPGAGYGGTGGALNPIFGGDMYGLAEYPQEPGSSGAHYRPSQLGGAGGGLVVIEASGTIRVSGIIQANGGVGQPDGYSGGGSGGGIYLSCETFAGTGGSLLAIGGNGGNYGGGGGGGRIAVWRMFDEYAGTLVTNVAHGTDNWGTTGASDGTVYFGFYPLVPEPAAMVLLGLGAVGLISLRPSGSRPWGK